MRFWEPRRLAYNLALGAVVVIRLVATWPHFRGVHSAPGPIRHRRRSTLWVVGTILALALEDYWIADEIYPFVQ